LNFVTWWLSFKFFKRRSFRIQWDFKNLCPKLPWKWGYFVCMCCNEKRHLTFIIKNVMPLLRLLYAILDFSKIWLSQNCILNVCVLRLFFGNIFSEIIRVKKLTDKHWKQFIGNKSRNWKWKICVKTQKTRRKSEQRKIKNYFNFLARVC